MQSMTKEHFWNLLQAQFPEQMNDFTRWIDEFKRREHWEILFNTGHETNYGPGERGAWPYKSNYHKHYPKFHDLPPAMQIGIFIQYTVETGGSPFPTPADLSFEAWIGAIPRWFEMEYELAKNAVE
jgi:hypothetical protein